jgi:hypothetical protein
MSLPKPQILLIGLSFGESPRWHEGRLWISDWGTQEIIAVNLEGRREVMIRLNFPSFQPICMDWRQMDACSSSHPALDFSCAVNLMDRW